MTFNFDLITVSELDDAMEAGRYSVEVRRVIAKAVEKSIDEINAMPVKEYKKLLANFIRAAYAPVDADPS